ncbi:MAG: ATP-binding protein [Sphingobacteriales bacterium]|nr:MAG: ATP-binding protein [Sphingobacteriales bacterium]
MGRIKIQNFGPVKDGLADKDGWIDFKKVTVFIGDQGSGKSTVAKLYSTLCWIEKAMVRGQIKPDELSLYNRFLKQLKYQRIDNYIKSNTLLEYEGKFYHFHFHDSFFFAEKASGNGYLHPKIMYVPAERNFLSVVERPDKLKNLPSPLFTFLDEYDQARIFYSKGIALPIGNTRFEYDVLNKMAHITGGNYKLRLSEASSGFQSTVPLFLVTKFLTESLHRENDNSITTESIEEQRRLAKEIEKIINDTALSEEIKRETLRQLSARYKPSCFVNIVEEPEQNLFPGSQQKLLHSLMEYNNKHEGNKLILTTHSAYIINYLTLAVKAEMVKTSVKSEEAARKLNEIVPLQSTVKPDDLAIYQMNEEDGSIHILPDYKGLPSDENYLNLDMEHSNELFAQLQEIEKGWR